jgi:hypothetical protein
MRKSVPDRKWKLLSSALKEHKAPKDPWLAKVYRVINAEEHDPTIEEALEYIDDTFYRDRIMAFLFSGATLAEVEQGTGVQKEVVLVIKELLLNSGEIRNKLDHFKFAFEYIKNYVDPSNDAENLIRMGILNGPQSLLLFNRLGNEPINLDVKDMLTSMTALAYNFSLIVRGNRITSQEAKLAQKWYANMAQMLTLRDRLKMEDDLEISAEDAVKKRHYELTAENSTLTLDEQGLTPEDILH